MTSATKIQEEVARIVARPYVRELIKNEDGTWFARIVEFAGCMTEGDTQAEVLSNLEDAMLAWVEVKVEDGDSIPNPITVDDYSGKFMVRVAKSLHRDIARQADREGVSLNAYVSTQLARAVCGEKGGDMADKRMFIERNEDGDYSVTRYGGKRASAIESTQSRAIDRACEIDPNASVEVERVRNTNRGGRDQWRKP